MDQLIPAPPKVERKRRPRFVLIGFLAALIVLIVVTVPAITALTRAANAISSAKASLNQAKADGQALDLEAVGGDLDHARASFIVAHSELQNTGFWRDLPLVGTQLRALEDASNAAAQTLDGAGNLVRVFAVVTDALKSTNGELTTGIAPTRSWNDLSKDEKRELLRRFSNALPDLRTARDKIDLALELWNRVPQTGVLPQLQSALKPLAENLPVLKQSLDEAVPLIETAVPLAGYPKPIHYLVLLQNADEIRPSGGFIGTVGTATLDAGDLTYAFTDVYNIDNPASGVWKEVPPKPLADRLGVKAWFLRDANWSPDFPTSADRLLDFYTREVIAGTGKPPAATPDAVVAFEPGLFVSLLKFTGPITVNGDTYTADNFYDKIEFQVEQGFLQQGVPIAQRKNVIQDIGTGLANALKGMPASRWGHLVDVVTKSFDQKQILFYSRDPDVLSILDRRGWTGRAKPTTGDFVWVVDANLAALKTDGVMKKQITYKLDAKDPSNAIATVTLKYTNTNRTITWRYTRYRSYTRAYVPDGSQLISSSGALNGSNIDVMHELGKMVFGAFWNIEPGQTGTLSFTYKLPASAIGESVYHLDWPKQAGADNTQLTLDLNFATTLKSAVPSEQENKWGDARYEYTTDTLLDRTFDLKF